MKTRRSRVGDRRPLVTRSEGASGSLALVTRVRSRSRRTGSGSGASTVDRGRCRAGSRAAAALRLAGRRACAEPAEAWAAVDVARNMRGTAAAADGACGTTAQVSGPCCRSERRSVKPPAQPTLVRTQHLPPHRTPAQGRYGVPDSYPGYAARCQQRQPDAAYRGIYAGSIRPNRAGKGPGRASHPARQRPASGSLKAVSMRVLAAWSPSSRHLAQTRSKTSRL